MKKLKLITLIVSLLAALAALPQSIIALIQNQNQGEQIKNQKIIIEGQQRVIELQAADIHNIKDTILSYNIRISQLSKLKINSENLSRNSKGVYGSNNYGAGNQAGGDITINK